MEEEGLSTAGISLVRDNTERLRPPRFLWVPFELGRPLGTPDNAAFQMRVLRHVLSLLEKEVPPPILEDFPDDAPGGGGGLTGWTCPISLPAAMDEDTPERLANVLAEIEALAPWYQAGLERRDRTATGVLGCNIVGIARFLHDAFDGVPNSPKDGVPVGEAFRQGCEELKTFYMEAAIAKPGSASSRDLADWFWGGTAAGRLLLDLHPAALTSTDTGIRRVAEGQMVPRLQKHRLG